MDELLIAANPDPGSSLADLIRVPLAGGLCYRTLRVVLQGRGGY